VTVEQNITRALFLLGTLEAGGSESKFVALAQRLKTKGRSIHIAYLGPPETLLPKLEGMHVVNLDRKGKWSFRAFRALSAYVEEHSIAQIVTVNVYPLSYAIPLTLFRRDLRISVIASINTSEMQSRRDRAFMRIYVPLLKRCKRIIFGSKRQQQDWLNMYRLPGECSRVIYNGVDGNVFDADAIAETRLEIRASLNIPIEASVIVCVSRLRPEKGHHNLLQAVAALASNYDLKPYVILVGDGARRSAIIDHAERLGIVDRLHMVGSTDDVRPYLKASDIFALTSTAVETFSNAALEATAMGLPVVISDVGGAMEMFPAGSSGTIYPRDDIEALVGALAGNLQSAQSGSIDKQETRNRVLRKFSVGAMDLAWIDAIWKQGRHEKMITDSPGNKPGVH